MSYMNLDSLKRYAQKEKEWSDEKFLSENDLNWQKTGKAGAVTCYPIGESPIEGTVEFKFKETLPVEGTKGPNNPSTITGVNNVKVTRCGKNLLPASVNYASGDTTDADIDFVVQQTGGVVADGTASGQTTYFLMAQDVFIPVFSGQKLFLSGSPSGSGSQTYYITAITYDSSKSLLNRYYDFGSGCSITVGNNEFYIRVSIVIKSGAVLNNVVFLPQLEIGTGSTNFENGSLQDYAITLGGTYYGGSVDLSTGIMTVTWAEKIFDGTETFRIVGESSGTPRFVYDLTDYNMPIAVGGANNSSCSHAVFVDDIAATWGSFRVTTSGTSSYFYMQDKNGVIASLDNYVSWVAEQYSAETPLTLAYKITIPYTVQLTPTQIKSLSALSKYEPRTNTVYSDQESVQVGYPKSPIATDNELTNAIISLGGNV